MTIKQQGGIFGRNPTFNNVDVDGDLNVGSVNLSNTTGTGNVVLSNDPVFGYSQSKYSGNGRCYSHEIIKFVTDIPDNTATDIFEFTKGAGGSSSDIYSHFAGTLEISAAIQLTGGYNAMQAVTIPFSLAARGSGNASLDTATAVIASAANNTGGTFTYTLSLSTATNTAATLALTVDCSNRTINVNDIGIKLVGISSCSTNSLRFDVDRT